MLQDEPVESDLIVPLFDWQRMCDGEPVTVNFEVRRFAAQHRQFIVARSGQRVERD